MTTQTNRWLDRLIADIEAHRPDSAPSVEARGGGVVERPGCPGCAHGDAPVSAACHPACGRLIAARAAARKRQP